MKSHAAVAAVLLDNEQLVNEVLADLDSSSLTDAEKVLMNFLDRVNEDSPCITAHDLEPVRTAGWNDEQIWYAITVCALFNFYNRWIDATGVHALSDQAHRDGAVRSAANGYAPK
jgi:alkylhydroperoxidase family enzyme